jgi:hypothetical protein
MVLAGAKTQITQIRNSNKDQAGAKSRQLGDNA